MKLIFPVIFMLVLVSALAILAQNFVFTPPSFPQKLDSIRQISCEVGDNLASSGTATVIEKDRILTAYHVIREAKKPCEFNGQLVSKTIYFDKDEDIAVVAVDTGKLIPIPIDCSGIVNEQRYMALGYPSFIQIENRQIRLIKTGEFPNTNYQVEINEGPPVLTSTSLIARGGYHTFSPTNEYPYTSHSMRLMEGSIFKGMSGGPVVNDAGRISGSINAIMGVTAAIRDLRDTNLCS